MEDCDPGQTTPLAGLEALSASAMGREGVIWSLEAGSDLNANLVLFGTGRGVGEHVNDEVDVVFVGVSGAGEVKVDDREHALNAGKLAFVPKGVRRSTRDASEDFAYLTVHRQRGPLRIGADSEPEQKRRRQRMSERRTSMIERVLHRIEEHVEEWRKHDAARKSEAASHREELWAEAAERQKLLAEAVTDGETPPASLEEMTKQHRVVFVLHREDLTGTLEAFAGGKDRLVNVVPGKGDYGSGKGIEGIRGSWLVFEPPEQKEQPYQR